MTAESRSSSHKIVPEIAHLIESGQTNTDVQEIGAAR